MLGLDHTGSAGWIGSDCGHLLPIRECVFTCLLYRVAGRDREQSQRIGAPELLFEKFSGIAPCDRGSRFIIISGLS